MSIPDVTGFTRIFCQKGLILLENGKTGFFCFTRVREPAHISKMSYPFGVEAAWHTVLICCQIGDRGSNPVAINQFLIFFLLGLHVRVCSFRLLIFFILCGLLYLI